LFYFGSDPSGKDHKNEFQTFKFKNLNSNDLTHSELDLNCNDITTKMTREKPLYDQNKGKKCGNM